MLEFLVDLVCMVYHESRNVRFPIRAGRIAAAEVPRYRSLISLPADRLQAWRQMQSVRTAAAAAKAPPSRAFEKKYGLTLPEVAELFDRPIWKDSARGGNKWAAVTRRIEQTLEARAAGETVYRNRLIHEVLAMAHNTGIVTEKLRGLRSFCEP